MSELKWVIIIKIIIIASVYGWMDVFSIHKGAHWGQEDIGSTTARVTADWVLACGC